MFASKTAQATLAIIFSAILWGLWWWPLRALEGVGLEGLQTSAWLCTVSGLGLLPLAWLRRANIRAGGRQLLAAGIVFGLAITLWNLSLMWGQVVRVTLLFYLAPVWGTLFGTFLLGLGFGPYRAATIVLGLAGAATLLGLSPDMFAGLGTADIIVLISGVLFALGVTITHAGDGVDGLDQTIIAFPVAAIVSIIALPFAGTPLPTDLLPALGWTALTCFAWLIPSTILLLWGARYLDPGKVTILLLAEVMTAAISAAILTDEPFGIREMAGCALIMAAGLAEGLSELRRARNH